MYQLNDDTKSYRRNGVSPTVAIPLLIVLGGFSAVTFFGVAHSMLQMEARSLEQDFGDHPWSQSLGAPTLASPVGTEVLAAGHDEERDVEPSPVVVEQLEVPASARTGRGQRPRHPARSGQRGQRQDQVEPASSTQPTHVDVIEITDDPLGSLGRSSTLEG